MNKKELERRTYLNGFHELTNEESKEYVKYLERSKKYIKENNIKETRICGINITESELKEEMKKFEMNLKKNKITRLNYNFIIAFQ